MKQWKTIGDTNNKIQPPLTVGSLVVKNSTLLQGEVTIGSEIDVTNI